jgi:hypothetical protein
MNDPCTAKLLNRYIYDYKKLSLKIFTGNLVHIDNPGFRNCYYNPF